MTTYRLNGEVVTREEFFKDARGITPGSAPLVNDFKAFVSPIDGTTISCKSELKAHEQKHNVVQVGNDFKNQINEMRRDAGL